MKKLKVLLIGQGGREHALCLKLSRSPYLEKLYCAPGNPGIGALAECLNIDVLDIDKLVANAKNLEIDLVVVGPEAPLEGGLVDVMEQNGIAVFGPSKRASRLETSKSFAKEVMNRAGVKTAKSFTVDNLRSAKEVIQSHFKTNKLVLKADGLAAGKGVHVCLSASELDGALAVLYPNDSVQTKVVIEEFIEGVEASFIVCVDGQRVVPLVAAHDYKRIGDGNRGPNTGGMGTVSPTPNLLDDSTQAVLEKVINPTLAELNNMEIYFRGFLFAGLMVTTQQEIYVLEFNVRLGDPETQVILARLKSDLLPLLANFSAVKEYSDPKFTKLEWDERAAVCVVQASKGYPQSYSKGDVITGLHNQELVKDAYILHAGTAVNEVGEVCTAGGRVLGVVGLGSNVEEAASRAYQLSDLIQFSGKQLRRDIGTGTNRQES